LDNGVGGGGANVGGLADALEAGVRYDVSGGGDVRGKDGDERGEEVDVGAGRDLGEHDAVEVGRGGRAAIGGHDGGGGRDNSGRGGAAVGSVAVGGDKGGQAKDEDVGELHVGSCWWMWLWGIRLFERGMEASVLFGRLVDGLDDSRQLEGWSGDFIEHQVGFSFRGTGLIWHTALVKSWKRVFLLRVASTSDDKSPLCLTDRYDLAMGKLRNLVASCSMDMYCL
jgi:hypothetical protein